MADINQWLSCAKGVGANIQKLDVTIQTYDLKALTIEQVKVDRTKVTNFRRQLDEISMAVFKLCTTDKEIEKHNKDICVFIQFLDKMDIKLSDWDHKLVQMRSAQETPVRLPNLDLMTFDGKYCEWLAFRDMFNAAIIKNKLLTNAQRLQYLKSAVRGDAERVVKSFPVTDANFVEAWKLLTERYDNTREVVFAIVRKLHSQQQLKTENANALKRLIDTSLECVRSLKALSRPVDKWDDLLVFAISEKLDPETKREWARSLTGADVPTWAEFIAFLETHVRALVAMNVQRSDAPRLPNSARDKKASLSHTAGAGALSCAACSQGHMLHQCEGFLALSVQERVNLVKNKRLCFNCMNKHTVKDCKSKSTCKHCKMKHNSLLHFNKSNVKSVESSAATADSSAEIVSSQNATTAACAGVPVSTRVLLATAVVSVQNASGGFVKCRVLLDSGSESSFITQKCVEVLGLQRRRSSTIIKGVSGITAGRCLGIVSLCIKSFVTDFEFHVEALILPKVTGNLPSYQFRRVEWQHLKGLALADPEYFKSREVDLILGADILGVLMLDGKVSGPPLTPIAQQTHLGWILSGKVSDNEVGSVSVQVFHSSVEDLMQKFWQLESVPEREQFTTDEWACEKHFRETISRQADGRYVTRLPFNSNIGSLGFSKEIALKRLQSVERRLSKLPDQAVQYQQFMKEYLELGHMEPVPAPVVGEFLGKTNYLPHHFVTREESTTTKLRVVFDGAAKTTTGLSLNQCLYAGPNLLPDIFEILVRFRSHRVAIKADMVKCFRQFSVHDLDRDFQRILWRFSAKEPVQEFRLNTVTYGTICGPYLAMRCIRQMAEDEADSYPLAAAVTKKDFYVDDLLTGTESVSDAAVLLEQMQLLMVSAQLKLNKWDSNESDVVNLVDPAFRETRGEHYFDKSDTNKALGVAWDAKADMLVYSGYKVQELVATTKRTVLSEMARVFDPLGLLSPATVLVKLYFQDLWKPIVRENGEMHQFEWDEPIPQQLQERWIKYRENLRFIREIAVPRCIDYWNCAYREFHGFCDASELAYAAVVYLRCYQPNDIRVSLVAAKTKVAPLRQVSLPRLELCAALLLSRLISAVTRSVEWNCPVSAWSDSEVALRWISGSSRRWKTFVANRVAEIQETIPGEAWHYVPTDDNPADCASRGVLAKELVGHKLWWSGPKWLSLPEVPRFAGGNLDAAAVANEQKATYKICFPAQCDASVLDKFSTLSKLKHVMCYVLRFIHNCRGSRADRVTGWPSVDELKSAFLVCVKMAQNVDFAMELQNLRGSIPIRSGSLCSLNPFIDSQGVIRVGGRIQQDVGKQQILLSGHNNFTKLIIRHVHVQLHHAGFQLLSSTLAREWWIIKARGIIRHMIRSCLVCKRYRAEAVSQMMGQLPTTRTTPSRPFTHAGVDYAGPITLQTVKGRGKLQFKGYFCLFVCFSTKAVHLEAVTSLTAEAFIATLKRFISRRGVPSDLYSDQGTNFVGADKELRHFVELAERDRSVSHFKNENAIKWHFNPPSAPHMGGLWEAGVKSAKYHLKRVIGKQTLTLEEFFTLLAQVEAVMNSRPLGPLSSEPEDYNALTPGHFLIGEPLRSLPEPSYLDLNENRLSRWQRAQQMFQHFWKRWAREYLHTLQQRSKWKHSVNNLKVGDLVLVNDGNSAPTNWPMGRVIQVHVGDDGLVRVVTIRTAHGQFQRPIVKLVRLVAEESAEQRQ